MPCFATDHVFILPHPEEYRILYNIPLRHVVERLSNPDSHEELTIGRYTAEKTFRTHRVYVYYYRTLPLKAKTEGIYAIVDFIG